MAPDIRFPNLGIEFDNVIKIIPIGSSFSIAMYGIMVVLGMIAGVFIAQKRAVETGQNEDFYLNFAVFAIIFSVIGARIYYVIFSLDEFRDDFLKIFNLRTGGLAIYGGVIFAVIAAYVYGKIKKKSFLEIADTCVMGLIAGQAIGRWGNFFNREAFGSYTDSLFAMQIKVSQVTQGNINNDAVTQIINYAGENYYQVHPTFLYEFVWNLFVLIILFVIRNKTVFKGELFAFYLALYSLGRFFIEGIRTDQLRFAGIAVSQALALVVFLFSVLIIVYKRIKFKSDLGK